MSTLRIQRIQTLEELQDIKNTWTTLESMGGGTSIFQTWLWNRTWCEHFLRNRRRLRLDVRVVEDSAGKTLAILPFYQESLVGPLLYRLRFLGYAANYHNDILLSEPDNQELAASVIMAMRKDLGARSLLYLSSLNGESVFAQELIRQGMAKPHCAYVWLPADQTAANPYKRMSRITRKRFRNKLNKLQREFDVDFQVRSGVEFPEAFAELVQLSSQRFASKGESTLLTGSMLDFMRSITATLNDSGQAEILQLRANGKTVAANLAVRHANIYYSLKSGFDPSFYSFSPMHLLDAESMRHGFQDLGCDKYEYGGAFFAYKFDWDPEVGMNYYCFLGDGSYYAKSAATLFRMIWNRQMPVGYLNKEQARNEQN